MVASLLPDQKTDITTSFLPLFGDLNHLPLHQGLTMSQSMKLIHNPQCLKGGWSGSLTTNKETVNFFCHFGMANSGKGGLTA
jgi:hypothetical protein